MNFIRILIFALILIFLNGCAEKSTPKFVNYIKVNQPEDKNYKEFHGIVKSQLISKLSFQTEGRIIFMPYTRGDYVKKGQVLARLDGILYKIRKNEEQARLKDYTVQYNKQKSYYKRMDMLHKEGGISDNDWEDAYYGLKSLDEQIKIQKEKINYIDKEISYNIITAPFDGFISEKLAEVGTYAQIGSIVLVITGTNQTQVETMVDSNTINKINLNEEVLVKRNGIDYTGKIAHISRTSINSGGYLVKINLDRIYEELKDGMSTDVEISYGNNYSNRLPLNCIFEENNKKYVYKIVNIKDNIGEIAKEKVETGQIFNDEIEIIEGIFNGDLIISQNQDELVEHEKVKI